MYNRPVPNPQTPTILDMVPKDLVSHLENKVSEARVSLSLLKSSRDSAGFRGSRMERSLVGRFKASASELSIRFDTISAMLPDVDPSPLASLLGCRWDQRSRRLDIGPAKTR